MPNINIDDAYILGETGAQVDKVTGLFTKDEDTTSGEKAFAQLNIGTAGSNRNLLDNPWFTVNQRSFTSVTEGNGAPLVDRWKAYRATVVLNSDNSMTVTPTQNQYGICQFIEADRLKVGETYTMSALIDGEILSASFVYNTTPASVYFVTFPNGIRFYRHYANGVVDFWVIRQTMDEFVVQAVKLEKGSVSTLANDAPPNYAEELRKCQYYFKRFSPTAYTALWSGLAVNATMGAFFVAGEMRNVRPVVTVSGTGYMAQAGSMKIITSGEAYYTRQGTRLLLTTSATLTVNNPVTVYTSANQNFVVDINAEY